MNPRACRAETSELRVWRPVLPGRVVARRSGMAATGVKLANGGPLEGDRVSERFKRALKRRASRSFGSPSAHGPASLLLTQVCRHGS